MIKFKEILFNFLFVFRIFRKNIFFMYIRYIFLCIVVRGLFVYEVIIVIIK